MYAPGLLLKPVFVSKKQRSTVSERERAEAAEMEMEKVFLSWPKGFD